MEQLLKPVNFWACSVFTIIFLVGHSVSYLPPRLQGCHLRLGVESFDDCIKTFLHEFRNNMRQGIPELNLPRYDPLSVDRVDFKKYTKYFKLDGILRKLHVIGASEYEIDAIHLDKQSLTFGISMNLRSLDIKTNFEFIGSVLGAKVRTHGVMTGKFSDSKLKMIGQLNTTPDSNGVPHMNIASMRTFVEIGEGPLNIKTPPELQWAANMIVNFYGKSRTAMLKVLTPMINDVDDQVLLKMVQPIFNAIKRDEFLIPS